MKVVFTDDALRDLDEILQYISANYPSASRVGSTTAALTIRT